VKIDFFTFIGNNSAKYAWFLKYTCEKFLSGKHKIHWKCIKSVGSNMLPFGYECVARSEDKGHNSMNHAAAMNLAQKYVEHDYVIFIDADVAILYKGWDDIIVNELNNYDCFGASYGHGMKYVNFPTVYLFAFRSYILDKIELDFSPELIEGDESVCRYIIPKEESEYFGKEEGSVLKCDTGWKLPLIKKAGFTGNSMPMVLMTSKDSQLPFESIKHEEFCFQKPSHMSEWHYNGKLFATHKQASRNHPLDGEWGQAWKKRIELYIKSML